MNPRLTIKLSKGHALIDPEDLEWLSAHKWTGWNGYAHRSSRRSETGVKKRHTIRMHRAIWEHHNGPIPGGLQIDHINRDGLDNRKANLRLATPKQNAGNTRPLGGSSKYKGVGLHVSGKWVARLHTRSRANSTQKLHHLGVFDAEEDAARAYDAAAREWFGEFAYVNFNE